MAVTVHEEQPNRSLKENAKGVLMGRRTFEVKVNSNTNPEFDIRNHPDTPKKGDSYSPAYSGVIAKNIEIRATGSNEDNMFEWLVIVDYDSNYDPDDDVENPLEMPDKIRYGSEFIDEIIYQDVQLLTDIKNSAEEQTPILTKKAMPLITYIKNVNAIGFNPFIQDAVNTVNENNVNIDGNNYIAKNLYCKGIDISEVLYKNNIAYRQLTYKILVESRVGNLHRVKLLNQGKRELVEAPDNYRLILLPKSKQPVSTPWPLDEFGKALDPANANANAFTYKEWNVFETFDWSQLGLA